MARVGRRVAIVRGLRTPFVKAGTVFGELTALELGRIVVQELIQRSDIDSVPPMIATSEVPTAMVLAASTNAWMLVAQARAAVWASMCRGSPAAITTSRAMLVAVRVGIT